MIEEDNMSTHKPKHVNVGGFCGESLNLVIEKIEALEEKKL